MSSGPYIPGAEELIAHVGFVRALARSLLLDSHRADDVAQQALLVAMERGSERIRSPRAWLATVTRNLVRRSFRADRRRARRERAVARSEVARSPEDPVVRLETTERLVRAVRELREPFRQTVVLRFFQGLTPEEIAGRDGIPSSTVRGRLSRALAMLRERLDADHEGDRRAWSAALLALALPEGASAGAAPGGATALALSGKSVSVVALVLVALCVGGALLVTGPTAPPEPERREQARTAPPAVETVPAAEAAAPPAPAVERTARKDWPVRVRTNVPGAKVTVTATYYGGEPDPPPLVMEAGADGVAGFELPERDAPLHSARARATAPGYAPAEAAIVDGEAVLELRPGRPLSGRVTDEAGKPIAGATVLSGPGRAPTDEAGRFTVHVGKGSVDDAGTERFTLLARHRSYLERRVGGVSLEDEPVIALSRGRTAAGRVVDGDGRPVPGLWIMAGNDQVRTGLDGSFALGALPEDAEYLSIPVRAEWMGENPGGGAYDCVEIGDGRDILHEFGYSRIHMVRVQVRDEAGRPFRYATLVAKDVPRAGWGGATRGDSGADGSAIFCAAWAPRVEVTAAAPGWAPTTEAVEFADDEVTADVTIVLRRPQRTGGLRLAVRTDEGEVPPHVYFRLSVGDLDLPGFRGERVDLDAEGRGRVDGLPPGTYRASVAGTKWPSTEGYGLDVSREVRVEPGSVTDLAVEIPTGGRVEVTVTDRGGKVIRPPWNIHLRTGEGWLVGGTLGAIHPGGAVGTPREPGPVKTLYPVRPGRAFVEIRRGEEVLAREEIEVLRGRTVEVTIPID